MPYDQELLAQLAALVADYVPPAVLAEVVAAQGVVVGYDDLLKLGLGQPTGNDLAVATRVVDAYARADRIEDFVRSLIRRDPGNALFAEGVACLLLQMLSADTDAKTQEEKNKQAAIAKRAQMLQSSGLLKFMRDIEGRVCVVGAEFKRKLKGRQVVTGTGFLVGPDLVLTARHVLGDHILAGQQNPAQTGRRCVFFDHLDGDPIGDPLVDPPPPVRRVDFHPTHWLESWSDELLKDGLFDPQDVTEIEEARARLDFVLVRLAQPVGNHSRRATGGARRGWIDLWPAGTAAQAERLAEDDRIIIPQHPNGHPQQIDFGRYVHVDPSESRIRYDTETEEGTSGAPCFDQNFHLVGVHNAYYKVPPNPRLNQAIRFDRIHGCLQRQVIQPAPAPSRLWSVADDESKPQVILGRAKFQDWIGKASAIAGTKLAQRAFVVEGHPRSGKSFSARILRAARRDLPERIVVLGRDKDPVPQGAADFLRILASQLRIPKAELESMPLRPSEQLPASGDGDKLALWQSKDLPQWFARALAQTRLLQARSLQPADSDLEPAALPGRRYEERSLWERVWIVLDDTSEEAVSSEVKDLIASLLGVGIDEEAITEELRRLRWVFLGWRPAFLEGIVEVEPLDPMTIGHHEIETCVHALIDSFAGQADETLVERAFDCVAFARTIPKLKEALADPDSRLAVLQEVVGTVRTFFAAVPGQRT